MLIWFTWFMNLLLLLDSEHGIWVFHNFVMKIYIQILLPLCQEIILKQYGEKKILKTFFSSSSQYFRWTYVIENKKKLNWKMDKWNGTIKRVTKKRKTTTTNVEQVLSLLFTCRQSFPVVFEKLKKFFFESKLIASWSKRNKTSFPNEIYLMLVWESVCARLMMALWWIVINCLGIWLLLLFCSLFICQVIYKESFNFDEQNAWNFQLNTISKKNRWKRK